MPGIGLDKFRKLRQARSKRWPLEPWGLGPEDYLEFRQLSARDLLELQQEFGGTLVANLETMSRVFGKVLLSDTGGLLFADAEAREEMMAQPLDLLEALFKAVLEFSGVKVDVTEEDGLPNSPRSSSSSPVSANGSGSRTGTTCSTSSTTPASSGTGCAAASK